MKKMYKKLPNVKDSHIPDFIYGMFMTNCIMIDKDGFQKDYVKDVNTNNVYDSDWFKMHYQPE